MTEFHSIDGFAYAEVNADREDEGIWPSMVRFEWDDDNIETLVADDARALAALLIAAANQCDGWDRARFASEESNE